MKKYITLSTLKTTVFPSSTCVGITAKLEKKYIWIPSYVCNLSQSSCDT